MSVPATGGEPQIIARADPSQRELYWFPSFLPDGKAILFSIVSGEVRDMDQGQIALLDLATGRHTILASGGTQPEYVADARGQGYVVYATGVGLRAVRFDVATRTVSGAVFDTGEPVMTWSFGAAEYAVSRTGAFAFVSQQDARIGMVRRSLVWVSRTGDEERVDIPSHVYGSLRLSPDGRRAVTAIYEEGLDVWIVDLVRRTLERPTTHPAPDNSPVWTPDGGSIVWGATGQGAMPNIYRQSASGTGTPERLTETSNPQFPTSVTPDGSRLLVWAGIAAGGKVQISLLDLRPDAGHAALTDARPLVHDGTTTMNGEVSPDGKWVVYQSNASGRDEIYVRPFPDVDVRRLLVSTAGGTRPAWSPDGREIFYLDNDGLLTSVSVNMSISEIGRPVRLLQTVYFPGASTRGAPLRGYDVSPDGRRFLMIKDDQRGQQAVRPAPITMVINWADHLRDKTVR
jgi:serine/threonine-protein kinase